MSELVLVVGGGGFIGSRLVRLLVNRGYRVRVADIRVHPTRGSIDGCDFVVGDITNDGVATRAFANADVCINLAAKVGGVGYLSSHPGTILSQNCRILATTFGAAAKFNLSRMIYISSSFVFERGAIPHRERDILSMPFPLSGYGFSKLIGERFCHAFFEEFGLPFTIIRPFNVYGPGEMPGAVTGHGHVIPELIYKILSGQRPLELLGDGRQTRCFTHVRDIARGIVLALESEEATNEDFNLGSRDEISVLDLAKKLWRLCGREEAFAFKTAPSLREDVRRRLPDVSKARSLLGWEATITLDAGLEEVVDSLCETLVGGR